MNYTQTVQKWGNGTGVRLPKKVVEAAHFEPNQEVAIKVEGKSVVLTPVPKTKAPRTADEILEDMLRGVTPADVGGEYDWGPPVGVEVW